MVMSLPQLYGMPVKAQNEVRHQLDEALTYKAEGALRHSNRKYYQMSNKASYWLLAYKVATGFNSEKSNLAVQCPRSGT